MHVSNFNSPFENTPFRSISLKWLTTLGAAMALAITASAQIKYEVLTPQVLGNPISKTQSYGNEINNNGQSLLNRLTTFAIWQNGSTLELVNARTSGEAIPSTLTAANINDSKQVVGFKTFITKKQDEANFITIPFYWDEAVGLINLDELGDISASGLSNTSLYRINGSGTAIGTSQIYSQDIAVGTRGFIWTLAEGEVSIPHPNSENLIKEIFPQAINNDGQVVGIYHENADSGNSYYEQAFLFDSTNGSERLDVIDPDFFSAKNITARDINDNSVVIGELDRTAYAYDLDTNSGQVINGFGENATARAYAINNSGVIAGYGEVIVGGSNIGYAPLLWTKDTGSLNLIDYLCHDKSEYLPEGIGKLDSLIQPKSINEIGQISAKLQAENYSREIILNPVLDFQWKSIEQTTQNGLVGIRYTHSKSYENDTISLSALGLEFSFYCSSDMEHWNEIDFSQDAASISENENTIELFIPLAECAFIQVGFKPAEQ